MESALYTIHALMRSFTTWENILLPEHQRSEQKFSFSASTLIISVGISVKQRETASFKSQDSLMQHLHHYLILKITSGFNSSKVI